MKPTRLIFYTFLFCVLIGMSIGCKKRECKVEDEVVNIILTPELLTFFPYGSIDTLSFLVDQKYTYKSVSKELSEGVITSKEIQDYICGNGIIYNNYSRRVEFYNSNNIVIGIAKFLVKKYNSMEIEIYFPNTELRTSCQFELSPFAEPDTLTIDGKFYNDIFQINTGSAKTEYYYSKSKGLIRLVKDGKVVFQLLN